MIHMYFIHVFIFSSVFGCNVLVFLNILFRFQRTLILTGGFASRSRKKDVLFSLCTLVL
jgi:hypothetical protein